MVSHLQAYTFTLSTSHTRPSARLLPLFVSKRSLNFRDAFVEIFSHVRVLSFQIRPTHACPRIASSRASILDRTKNPWSPCSTNVVEHQSFHKSIQWTRADKNTNWHNCVHSVGNMIFQNCWTLVGGLKQFCLWEFLFSRWTLDVSVHNSKSKSGPWPKPCFSPWLWLIKEGAMAWAEENWCCSCKNGRFYGPDGWSVRWLFRIRMWYVESQTRHSRRQVQLQHVWKASWRVASHPKR